MASLQGIAAWASGCCSFCAPWNSKEDIAGNFICTLRLPAGTVGNLRSALVRKGIWAAEHGQLFLEGRPLLDDQPLPRIVDSAVEVELLAPDIDSLSEDPLATPYGDALPPVKEEPANSDEPLATACGDALPPVQAGPWKNHEALATPCGDALRPVPAVPAKNEDLLAAPCGDALPPVHVGPSKSEETLPLLGPRALPPVQVEPAKSEETLPLLGPRAQDDCSLAADLPPGSAPSEAVAGSRADSQGSEEVDLRAEVTHVQKNSQELEPSAVAMSTLPTWDVEVPEEGGLSPVHSVCARRADDTTEVCSDCSGTAASLPPESMDDEDWYLRYPELAAVSSANRVHQLPPCCGFH